MIHDKDGQRRVSEPEEEGRRPHGKPKAGGTLTLSAKTAVPVFVPAEAVHTICNYEGIKVQVGGIV